jgi:hypothetical protein
VPAPGRGEADQRLFASRLAARPTYQFLSATVSLRATVSARPVDSASSTSPAGPTSWDEGAYRLDTLHQSFRLSKACAVGCLAGVVTCGLRSFSFQQEQLAPVIGAVDAARAQPRCQAVAVFIATKSSTRVSNPVSDQGNVETSAALRFRRFVEPINRTVGSAESRSASWTSSSPAKAAVDRLSQEIRQRDPWEETFRNPSNVN